MNKSEFINYLENTEGGLRRFLASLCCGDMFLVDELAQETYIKAYLSFEKCKDSRKFKAWLLKIAYNSFINDRRNYHPSISFDQMSSLESCNSADSKFLYEDLYQSLNSLPPTERACVILYYMEGYSTKEIAEFLNTKDQNVRKALSRGRDRLKTLLK